MVITVHGIMETVVVQRDLTNFGSMDTIPKKEMLMHSTRKLNIHSCHLGTKEIVNQHQTHTQTHKLVLIQMVFLLKQVTNINCIISYITDIISIIITSSKNNRMHLRKINVSNNYLNNFSKCWICEYQKYLIYYLNFNYFFHKIEKKGWWFNWEAHDAPSTEVFHERVARNLTLPAYNHGDTVPEGHNNGETNLVELHEL